MRKRPTCMFRWHMQSSQLHVHTCTAWSTSWCHPELLCWDTDPSTCTKTLSWPTYNKSSVTQLESPNACCGMQTYKQDRRPLHVQGLRSLWSSTSDQTFESANVSLPYISLRIKYMQSLQLSWHMPFCSWNIMITHVNYLRTECSPKAALPQLGLNKQAIVGISNNFVQVCRVLCQAESKSVGLILLASQVCLPWWDRSCIRNEFDVCCLACTISKVKLAIFLEFQNTCLDPREYWAPTSAQYHDLNLWEFKILEECHTLLESLLLKVLAYVF